MAERIAVESGREVIQWTLAQKPGKVPRDILRTLAKQLGKVQWFSLPGSRTGLPQFFTARFWPQAGEIAMRQSEKC